MNTLDHGIYNKAQWLAAQHHPRRAALAATIRRAWRCMHIMRLRLALWHCELQLDILHRDYMRETALRADLRNALKRVAR